MVINDKNLKNEILERLKERESRPSAEQLAERRISEELAALATAAKGKNPEEIYASLVKIGQCFTLLKMHEQALNYFTQALDEFPDKRFPVFAIVMTLNQLGRTDEAEKYARTMEENNP